MLPWKETHPFQGAVSAKTAREALCPEKGIPPSEILTDSGQGSFLRVGKLGTSRTEPLIFDRKSTAPWLYKALGSNHSSAAGTLGGRASTHLFTLKKDVYTHTKWMCP